MRERSKNMKKILIYTDGGCRCHVEKGGTIKPTDKSAYAVFMKYGNHEKLFGEGFYGRTNNDMELTAFIEGLKTLKRYDICVEVYSDSAYVVNTINQKWYVKWRANNWNKKGGLANADLWKEAIELYEKFENISVIHVKGHNGDLYNEKVDKHLNNIMDELPSL